MITNRNYGGTYKLLNKEETRKRNKICEECEIRKLYKKMDFHFDWIDCPFDCENDIEHAVR